jgi:hypothetical protein
MVYSWSDLFYLLLFSRIRLFSPFSHTPDSTITPKFNPAFGWKNRFLVASATNLFRHGRGFILKLTINSGMLGAVLLLTLRSYGQ